MRPKLQVIPVSPESIEAIEGMYEAMREFQRALGSLLNAEQIQRALGRSLLNAEQMTNHSRRLAEITQGDTEELEVEYTNDMRGMTLEEFQAWSDKIIEETS